MTSTPPTARRPLAILRAARPATPRSPVLTRCRPLLCALGLLAGVPSSHGQAIPAATADPISTGFHLPSALGSMTYSVSAVETLTSGYGAGSGFQAATGLNGNLGLISPSRQYPTSLVFAGGRFWSTSSQPSTNYADFAISQVVNGKHWNAVLTDSLAYLPATPSVGLAGVAGTGDLGAGTVQVGVDPGLGILSQYATRISNAASLNLSRQITARTSLQGAGAYTMLRFLSAPAGQQYDSNTYTGSGGLSHQIDARNTVSGNYAYSSYTYLGGLPGFVTHTVSAGYNRRVSKLLTLDLQAGPQWISAPATQASATVTASTPASTSLNAFISFNASYLSRLTTYNLGYYRGANAGYGLTGGTKADSVRFSASRTVARVYAVSANAAYTHSVTLGLGGTQSLAPQTFVFSAQASRALARSFSAFVSYTLEKQGDTGTAGLFNVFNGSFHVIGFGITYAPPAHHFGNH